MRYILRILEKARGAAKSLKLYSELKNTLWLDLASHLPMW